VRDRAHLAVDVYGRIEALGKVVVAAINGMPLAADLSLQRHATLRIAAMARGSAIRGADRRGRRLGRYNASACVSWEGESSGTASDRQIS